MACVGAAPCNWCSPIPPRPRHDYRGRPRSGHYMRAGPTAYVEVGTPFSHCLASAILAGEGSMLSGWTHSLNWSLLSGLGPMLGPCHEPSFSRDALWIENRHDGGPMRIPLILLTLCTLASKAKATDSNAFS